MRIGGLNAAAPARATPENPRPAGANLKEF